MSLIVSHRHLHVWTHYIGDAADSGYILQVVNRAFLQAMSLAQCFHRHLQTMFASELQAVHKYNHLKLNVKYDGELSEIRNCGHLATSMKNSIRILR